MKKRRFWLASFFLVGIISVLTIGCGTITKNLQTKVETVTTIGSSEVTISGTVVYSDGTVDIKLNPIIPPGGDAVDLTTSKVRIKVSKSVSDITGKDPVTVSIPVVSKKIDIVFVLDNTGSMSDAIEGSKNSIVSFAQSLEAAGVDVKFGLVTFGDSPKHPTPPGLITDEGDPSYTDAYYTREVMYLGDAIALREKLASVEADGGGDLPENPLDAIMWGYRNMDWRPDAQKVFVVITDINAHQITDTVGRTYDGGNRCTTSAEAVISELFGKAVVYAVSPDFTYGLSNGLLDVRRLADGLGEGRITPESNTGGKWIEFKSSGFDLNKLGIATTLAKSYTLRFSYSLDEGTWYILVEIDTDGDGVFDSNMLIRIGVSSASAKAYTVFSNEIPKPVAASAKKPYVAPPNN